MEEHRRHRSARVFRVTNFLRLGNDIRITFPTVVGRLYTTETSTDLATWTLSGNFAGTGNALSITAGSFPGDRLFVRVRVGPLP